MLLLLLLLLRTRCCFAACCIAGHNRARVPPRPTLHVHATHRGIVCVNTDVHVCVNPDVHVCVNPDVQRVQVRLQELFTWAHGDGGPSERAAPDGGIGM